MLKTMTKLVKIQFRIIFFAVNLTLTKNSMVYGTRGFKSAFTIIPILSQINPIPRIDTYIFKIYSNIVFPSTPRPS